jgi:hypothetical protein
VISIFSCLDTWLEGRGLAKRKASSLTGVIKGVVSGVASMAGSGGDSITICFEEIFLLLTVDALIVTFSADVILTVAARPLPKLVLLAWSIVLFSAKFFPREDVLVAAELTDVTVIICEVF